MDIKPPERIIFQNKRASCRTLANTKPKLLVENPSAQCIKDAQVAKLPPVPKKNAGNVEEQKLSFSLKSLTDDIKDLNVIHTVKKIILKIVFSSHSVFDLSWMDKSLSAKTLIKNNINLFESQLLSLL